MKSERNGEEKEKLQRSFSILAPAPRRAYAAGAPFVSSELHNSRNPLTVQMASLPAGFQPFLQKRTHRNSILIRFFLLIDRACEDEF
jgi:hypothetical protein